MWGNSFLKKSLKDDDPFTLLKKVISLQVHPASYGVGVRACLFFHRPPDGLRVFLDIQYASIKGKNQEKEIKGSGESLQTTLALPFSSHNIAL